MIAIDFGTTNSSIAVFSEGDTEPRLQTVGFGDPDSYNDNVLPSAVCRCSSDTCQRSADTYGHAALRHYFDLSHDSRLLQEMKLYFDRATQDPATLVETKTIPVLREEAGVLTQVTEVRKYRYFEGLVPLEPKDFVPGTARLIGELLRLSKATPEDRAEIIIGVPASFSESGMKRLREATKRGVFGEAGGYERIHLYQEPLAAARAYRDLENGNVLVMDYGGGTLDITVMRLEKSRSFERSRIVVSGFPEGGSRMDEEILNHCLNRGKPALREWHERQPIMMKLRIKRNVERAKVDLSRITESFVEFPGSGFDPIRLTREDLSFALLPIMTRMSSKVTQTVVSSVSAVENIDFVVLSGGTSLSPVVQRVVMAMFRHVPCERFVLPDANNPANVETCLCAVAKGLAWLRKDAFLPMALPLPGEEA